MTPEKRPAEDEEGPNNKAMKLDGDEAAEAVQDEESQDSVVSSNGSDSEKKIPGESGTLLWAGCRQWDHVGRRNVVLIPANISWAPVRFSAFAGIPVSFVASQCTSVHAVIITSTGQTWTLGKNERGQLGVGDTEEYKGPQKVTFLEDKTVVKAATGRNHTLFLTDRGTVYGCGDNRSGQCGVGNNTQTISTPMKVNFKEGKVESLACGAEFSMIVDDKGLLYSFGLPEYGQLGHNTDGKFFVTSNKIGHHFETSPRRVPLFVEKERNTPPTPITDVKIVQVACGNNHTAVVDTHGRCFTWGFGGYGRLGHAEQKDEMIPRLIKFFDGPKRQVTKIWCGAQYTCCQGNLGFFMWGQTKRTGEAAMYPKPIQDLCGWDIRSVGCSQTSTVVAADESVIAWGPSPTYGELGLGENQKSKTVPMEVKALDGAHVNMVTCGMGHTLYICRDTEEEDKKILGKLKEIEFDYLK